MVVVAVIVVVAGDAAVVVTSTISRKRMSALLTLCCQRLMVVLRICMMLHRERVHIQCRSIRCWQRNGGRGNMLNNGNSTQRWTEHQTCR